MAVSPATAHHRGRVAALSRDRDPDDPDLIEARRDLRAEVLAEHVSRVIAAAPPLSDEQLSRIAALLRAGAVTPLPNRESVVRARLVSLDGGGDDAA
jgi:hypothetical protein